METVAHSRQQNKVAVTLSTKINGAGAAFSGKSLYDDVYGGPPQRLASSSGLSPRFEDYGEIFGGFHAPRASSIPVLDLPAVDEDDAFFDPRSSAFSYNEVFGALDFAASYEDLLCQPSGLDGVSSEEEEAWTPADTDSFSGELDHSANNQNMTIGDYFRSVEGGTEFNMSYHKVIGTSNEHMSKGKTHMNAVPGFSTLVYGETAQLHETYRTFQVADDIDLEMKFGADKAMVNHPTKTMPHLRNVTLGEQTLANDLNLHNGCGRNGSHSDEMFITVSDISLRSMPSRVPPPSRPPPVLDAKKRDARGFHSNSGQATSGETPGDSSPPFFDVEVDMNSSAAAYAAAIKEAMHKAEAKLRSAKELKERKKGVRESHVKSSYDVKCNEAKTRSNCLDDETMQKTCDGRHSKMKISVTNERQKAGKASPETPDSLEGKRTLNMFEGKHAKESRSSQESDRSTGDGTWKEETEFFELVGTDESRKVFQPTKPTKTLVQDTRTHECGQEEIEASNMQEHKKPKAINEDDQVEEYEKKSDTAKEVYDHVKNIMRCKASNEERMQREQVKKEKVAEVFEQAENGKSIRMAHQLGKTEKKATEVDRSGGLKDVSEMRHKEHKQVEIEKSKKVDRQTPSEVQLGVRLKENEKKLEEADMQQQSVKMCRQSEKMKENGKMQREDFALGQARDEEKMKDFVELEIIDGISNEAFKQDITEETEACGKESEMRLKLAKQIQSKKGLKEACKRDEIEKSTEGSSRMEETDEDLKNAQQWDENEKQLKEEFQLEVNEIRLKQAFKKRESQACERDQNKKEFKEASDWCEEENRRHEAGDDGGIQKVRHQAPGKEWDGGVFNEALRKKEVESQSNQTLDGEGSVTVSTEDEDSCQEPSENMDKDVSRMGKDEGPDKALDQMEDIEVKGNMKIDKATGETSEKEISENIPASQSASILEEHIGKLKVSQESVVDQEIEMVRSECNVGENKWEEIGEENQLANEKTRAPEMTARNTEHLGTQPGKVDDSVKKADYGRTETAKPATVQEAVNVQKTAQWFPVGQSTERKEPERKEQSLNETSATLAKDAERMRRERELEKDRLRKIEEERDRGREREKDRMAVDKAMLEAEREREREKDRMAVDRATFEARDRDRAYAEACERAERAAFERGTEEARQRALAEARKRLEKACAEARDKSYADKVSTEARLKAERAAVERATAEAQERAMEKLKAERAASESRERLERSVSDQFGVCSRYGGRQDSLSSDMLDPQFQNFSTSTGSRHPYSLYGASSFSERSEREGESAQRCRARLERHRRTAERAAKALAEKNMRDLLAQKEQAERNRLAETLDAEVKRWSSGKEGNLRALLSTLQYILGPDCGWQPIPLTEVITSAAVKKAYRKATLCVHPDKLQQRGASIQHKYICEKVFDLLKEAWNKFNSEER